MSIMIESTMAFLYSKPPSSRRILLKKFMLDKVYECCSDEKVVSGMVQENILIYIQ